MNKNYKTAGEIAKEIGNISRQTVYFYEEFGLIKPIIKTESIKLYSNDTVELIKRIRELGKDHKLSYIKELLDREGNND